MTEKFTLNEFNIHKWSQKEIINFWVYEKNFPENFWGNVFGKAFIDTYATDIKKSKNILDFGCGSGSIISSILSKIDPKIQNVFGYEQDQQQVNDLKKEFKAVKNVTFFNDCDKQKNKFDLILCTEVIEHLYDKELNKLIEIFKRIKTPDGYIIFSTPNKEDLRKSLIYNPIDQSLFHRWQHVRSWDRIKLKDFLKNKGFSEFHFQETTFVKQNDSFIRKIYRKLKYKQLNLVVKFR